MSGNVSCRDLGVDAILRYEMKSFTAMTYNVLAQSYAHSDRYPRFPPGALDATRRHALPRLSRDTALPSLTEPSDRLPLCVDSSQIP